VQRLKDVFHSIGASSDKFTPSAENLPSTLEYIEGEVDALDEVIAGHADFCALLASRGTATVFLKAGCTHGKIVNRPNFSLSPADLVDIPSLARSIGNRFMTQIWINDRRKMARDEARSHLKPVRNLLSAFRTRGVPGPTSKLLPRAPAQMGRREMEREGGKKPEGDGR
jgi:hypothetical protein